MVVDTTLQQAKELAALDDPTLLALLRLRSPRLKNVSFLDLAEQLQRQSALFPIPFGEDSGVDPRREHLVNLLAHRSALPAPTAAAATPTQTPWWPQALTTAAQLSFILQQAAQKPIATGHKGNPLVKSVRPLAEHLGVTESLVLELLRLAAGLGLLEAAPGRLQTVAHCWWWQAEPGARWLRLAAQALLSSHPLLLAELLARPQAAVLAAEQLIIEFAKLPDAQEHLLRANALLLQDLGLVGATGLSDVAYALLRGEGELAAKLAAATLPDPESKIIVQPDLSAVATGPVNAAVQPLLLRFARIEQPGVATVYRFSEAAIKQQLMAGADPAAALSELRAVSHTPLPGPLEFLFAAIERSDRVVQVREHGAGSTVEAPAALVDLLRVDRALAPARFTPAPDSSALLSALSTAQLTHLLHDANYLVQAPAATAGKTGAAEQESGESAPQIKNADNFAEVLAHADAAALVAQLRKFEATTPHEQQLEHAIRYGLTTEITVTSGNKTYEFTLQPKSIAQGRLRAHDSDRETERVLPLKAITKLVVLER